MKCDGMTRRICLVGKHEMSTRNGTFSNVCTVFIDDGSSERYGWDCAQCHLIFKVSHSGFPGGAVVKNPPANAGDTGASPGPGRSHMLWSN